mmetsp:Transcript_5247/g.8932  ORF Transcript_5247/g.8932 Transcript_5247/m.8932 type:complete len:83 (-) Transcript_5247:1169-1417(-)
MPGELKDIEEQFTGKDQVDWTFVAAAMYGMSPGDLDAPSFGRLVVAQDTAVPPGRSSLWLQPESGLVIPQGLQDGSNTPSRY